MDDITLITKKNVYCWHFLKLPSAWYRHMLPLYTFFRKNAKSKNPEGKLLIEYAVFLSVRFYDRRFIDIALNTTEQEEFPMNFEIQKHLSVGSALCDLGHKDEGIEHLKESLDLFLNRNHTNGSSFAYLACCRMNGQTHWKHRLDYAIALTERYPDEAIVHELLCRAYFDLGFVDKAEKLLKNLMEESSEAGFLQAELSFSKGDYKAAADAFDTYQLHGYYHFWRMQFDYKKALAYHYSGQPEKCREQAIRIKRRLRWDKYYRLSDLDDTGIERVAEVDAIINSKQDDRLLIDPEEIHHYLSAFGWMVHYWFMRRWYVASIVLALGLILLRILM